MTLWLVYVSAAVFEIAGCFAFWLWLRRGQSPAWAVAGVAALVVFAWLLTRVDTDAAGRAYAAYAGVYLVASLLWMWIVERQMPTRWDVVGAIVSLAGAVIILAGARSRSF